MTATQKDRFVELLQEFGLEPVILPPVSAAPGSRNPYADAYSVDLVNNVPKLLGGYSGFGVSFLFNEDGSFRGVSIWE